MPNTNADACKVHFLPDDVTVEIERGSTILQAAQKGDVYINSLCGGDGICGKCRVRIVSGDVRAKATALLEREEVREGFVLACECAVHGDVEVEVPKEASLEGGKILVGAEAERFGPLSSGLRKEPFAHDPLVKKLYLALEPPSLESNIADLDRVEQAMRQIGGIEHTQAGYKILVQIPTLLRESDWKVTLTVGRRANTVELVRIEPGDTSGVNYGIAVDVGTTTVVAHLVDLAHSITLDTDAKYNSQMKYGEDYIRRIIHATEHNALAELKTLIITDINSLIPELIERNSIRLDDVNAVVCAGNTAMIHFLWGLDPLYIRKEPYIPAANFLPPIRAAEVGMKTSGRGLLYTLPSVSAYVGSDITAGVMAIGMDESEDLSLFIDVGTNGEVVLGNREWMVCCSASAGPAFEGCGIECGMRATRGAIESLEIGEDSQVDYRTIGDVSPLGVCGSGLLDALSELFTAGVLDRTGRFQTDCGSDRLRATDGGHEFVLVDNANTGIDDDIVITQADISNLIRSKAAIFAAISVLVESVELDMSAIQQVYLAGGFGNYLNLRHAITIGMLPDVDVSRVAFVGNTSVTGAKLALLSHDAFSVVSEIGKKMTYLDLMVHPKYMNEFTSAMFLPHTDIERFPTVGTRK